MRVGMGIVLSLAVLLLWFAPPASAASSRPAVGFWETRALDFDDQPLLSFEVRKRGGRRVVTRIFGAGPACEGGDALMNAKLRVGRRGGFESDRSVGAVPGFEAIRGRFVGGRRRAVVTVLQTDRPRCRRRLVLRRTARPRQPEGFWRGVDSTGAPIEFYVYFGGIGLNGPGRGSPPLRCADGSVYTPTGGLSRTGFSPYLFPRIDGNFEYYSRNESSAAGIDRLQLQGAIGATGISGTYRLIQTRPGDPNGPLCDSGSISFTASPPAP